MIVAGRYINVKTCTRRNNGDVYVICASWLKYIWGRTLWEMAPAEDLNGHIILFLNCISDKLGPWWRINVRACRDVTDLGCVLIWINGVNERINIRGSLLATSIMSICYIYFVLLVYGPFIDFTNHLFCFISVNICIYSPTWYIYIYSEFVVKFLYTF